MDAHVVAIGNFDGVHLGHQFVLRLVVDEAKRLGASSAVVTFEPLPAEVLRPDAAPARLTSTPDRLALIAAAGIAQVEVVPFTPELSRLSPAEFVDQLVARLHPVEVVVGTDFRFGHQRSGTVEVLRKLGAGRGFTVLSPERIGDAQSDFSSSRIRAALLEGDVTLANALLGRPYHLTGSVMRGFQRGRTLGFPTANLEVDARLAIPADGIYAGFALLAGESLLPAMIYIGSRPTFADAGRVVEVHLLDFNGDLYGTELTVIFARRIRGDAQFTEIEALVAQMEQDRTETRTSLAALDRGWSAHVLAVTRTKQGAPGGHD